MNFPNPRVIFGMFLLITMSGVVHGQQVRLRSRLTPECSTVPVGSSWKFADVHAEGNIAVQGSYQCRGAFIYDISNPDAPRLASHYNPTPVQQFLEAIVVGNRAYFGSGLGNAGVHIVDISNPETPVLLGEVKSTKGNGFDSVHEMMVHSQNGSTYLIENFNVPSIDQKIKIIDVTDPVLPVFKWEFTVPDGAWVHAMHIRGNRMFLSEFTGAKIEIYDISNLATQLPTLIGSISANTTNHSSWTSEDGNYLYSARETNDGDLRVYDIRDLKAPVLRKVIKAGDLNLNAITPHNPVVKGDRLYVSWYQAGVQIFDISDPVNPVRIGQYDTFPAAFDAEKAAVESNLRDEPWDAVCGAENLQNSLPTTFDGNWTVYPFLGDDKLIAGDLTAGLSVLDASGLDAAPKNRVSDFDGDRKTDVSVFDPVNGFWKMESSRDGSYYPVFWGLENDIPVPADYDGDGKIDLAVWRPSNGHWYWVDVNGFTYEYGWGLPGDKPVPGDYDADGRSDLAVWRPSNGTWYIIQSTLGVRVQQWGLAGDMPVVADYEGDGKPELAVWRPSDNQWYLLLSSSSQSYVLRWGLSGDRPLVTDFDGNRRSEITVFRSADSTWHALDPFTGSITFFTFGLAGDVPIPADYDGDGKTDLAVYRTSNNNWYFVYTSDWAFRIRQFGSGSDIPSPGSIQPR